MLNSIVMSVKMMMVMMTVMIMKLMPDIKMTTRTLLSADVMLKMMVMIMIMVMCIIIIIMIIVIIMIIMTLTYENSLCCDVQFVSTRCGYTLARKRGLTPRQPSTSTCLENMETLANAFSSSPTTGCPSREDR